MRGRRIQLSVLDGDRGMSVQQLGEWRVVDELEAQRLMRAEQPDSMWD
jgi:hypothetical protein